MSLVVAQARRCREQGQWAEAERLLRQAIGRSPRLAAAHLELGNLLKSLGRYREALAPLTEAVRWAPQAAAAWLNCGVAQLELGEREAAIRSFRQALALEPARPEAHNILGHALAQAGKTSLAATHLEEALRLKPGYAAAQDNLGRVRKLQGRAGEALAHHRAALAAAPQASIRSNLLYTLNLLDLPPEQIFEEHQRQASEGWSGFSEDALGKAQQPESEVAGPGAFGERAPPSEKDDGYARSAPDRLRIGYVSPDFCHHAVAYFIEPVLENHDRSQYEIFCYSDVRVPDAVTARLKARAEHWRETAGLGDPALVEAIRSDRIDVLVDLAGHTAGNRLGVFARRAAPAQFTWLGYPNTTGLAAMDYRITDGVADPAGTERWHSERLLRLGGPFSCYRPPEESPAVTPPPALTAGGAITFGCFNHIAKWNGALIGLWADGLRAVPQSRLLLKSRGLGDAETAAGLRRQFELAGVTADRLELLSAELGVAEHLALYGRVDIALDSFPYTGATTTCEALWMGVPVVTLAGQTHVSRVGASLLAAAGGLGKVAQSGDEYVRLAQALAADLPGLVARRAEQRSIMAQSPLCNGLRFTRELEDSFRRGWQEKVAGRAESRMVA
jgi:predicted O-linked N-acetylglucosamine transferase (SPINDLY family)